MPSVLAGPAIRDAVGEVPNIPLAAGVSETISGFQDALADRQARRPGVIPGIGELANPVTGPAPGAPGLATG